MAYESILVQEFEHEHETAQFKELDGILKAKFKNKAGTHLLIGNFFWGGAEMDALFIKENALCVIEMKSMGGQLSGFSENLEWTCDGHKIRAGNQINPFRQAFKNLWKIRNQTAQWERDGKIKPTDKKTRGHFSAMVLFGKPVRLENPISQGIDIWFYIKDPDTVAEKLSELYSPLIHFTVNDFNWFKKHFGGREARKEAQDPEEKKVEFIYQQDSDLNHMLRNLREGDSLDLRAVKTFVDWLEINRTGGDPLEGKKSSPLTEIEGARRYSITKEHSLIVVFASGKCFPVAIGTDPFIEKWIHDNKGRQYTIDHDHRIVPTFVNGKGNNIAKTTDANLPLLERIEIDLDQLIPEPSIRKALLEINEDSSDKDIDKILKDIEDENIRCLFSDVLYRLRSGEMEAAQARLELWNGNAIALEDDTSADDAFDSDINSENYAQIRALDEAQLKELLSPGQFGKWMVYLHREQRRIVNGTYKKPVVLQGVSGSGKTCILAHRALLLSERYPGERIGVLTLNENLSDLIKNLIAERCGGKLPSNIHVMPFFNYFQQLIKEFSPHRELKQLSVLAGRHRHGEEIKKVIKQVKTETYARKLDPLSGETIERTWRIFEQKDFVKKLVNGKTRQGSIIVDVFDMDKPKKKPKKETLSGGLRGGIKETLIEKDHDKSLNTFHYLLEEFSLIRSTIVTADRENLYLKSKRPGRDISIPAKCSKNVEAIVKACEEFDWRNSPSPGTTLKRNPIDRQPRLQVLELLLLWEEVMLSGGILDELSLTLALMPHRKDFKNLPHKLRFRSLLIDEYQDLSSLDLILLQQIPTHSEDGLMLAGDTVQRVLVKGLNLQGAGLSPIGDRTVYEKINKNYRNSRQILQAAAMLSEKYGGQAKELGAEVEILDPKFAEREGKRPTACKCRVRTEIKTAWEYAHRMFDEESAEPWSICIVTACEKEFPVEKIIEARPDEFPATAQKISGDYRDNENAVVVSTMSQVKGFDFSLVIIVGCGKQTLPPKTSCQGESWRYAFRLYVAMTRARDEVRFIYSGAPSEFLNVMKKGIERVTKFEQLLSK